jgi:hypothetical protein
MAEVESFTHSAETNANEGGFFVVSRSYGQQGAIGEIVGPDAFRRTPAVLYFGSRSDRGSRFLGPGFHRTRWRI